MLANNLANVTTAGYKLDREFYGIFSGEAGGDLTGSTLPVIERSWIDFSQGLLQETGNTLDFGLSGKGFFSVKGPSGALYTRNGSFRLDKNRTLVTPEGYPVQAVGGRTITAQNLGNLEIGRDGVVKEDGQELGRLALVELKDPGLLTKQGASYFRATDLAAVSPATEAEVHQGKLEASNVSSAESAARLVGVMRQFEVLQKAISLAGDMGRKAIEEVAKVGP